MTPIVPSLQADLDVGREWLETFDLSTVGETRFDDSVADPTYQFIVKPEHVQITDVFSVGNKVPFHATLTGPMQVGDNNDDGTLLVCGILTINNGKVERIEAVTDRFSLLLSRNRSEHKKQGRLCAVQPRIKSAC